jgi:peptidyl-tRNA hydrolase
MQYIEARENVISGKRIMFVEANGKITVSRNNNQNNDNQTNNNNQNNDNQTNNNNQNNDNQTNNNNTTDAPSTNTNNDEQNKNKEKSQTLIDKLKEFVDKILSRFKEKLTIFKNKGHISWITKNKDAILNKNYENISISTPIALSKGPTYLRDIDKIIGNINSKQYDNLFGFLKSPVTITDNEGKNTTINKDNNFSEIVTNQYTSEGGKVKQLSGDVLKKEVNNMLDYIIKYEAIVNSVSSKINELKNIKTDGIPSKTMSDIRTYSASILTAVEYKFTTYYKALVEISKQS